MGRTSKCNVSNLSATYIPWLILLSVGKREKIKSSGAEMGLPPIANSLEDIGKTWSTCGKTCRVKGYRGRSEPLPRFSLKSGRIAPPIDIHTAAYSSGFSSIPWKFLGLQKQGKPGQGGLLPGEELNSP
jgi:hypothetical protein